MDSVKTAASDPRVRAILTNPDAYFSAALRRAWPRAGADVQSALNWRAQARDNGGSVPGFRRLLSRSTRTGR